LALKSVQTNLYCTILIHMKIPALFGIPIHENLHLWKFQKNHAAHPPEALAKDRPIRLNPTKSD